LGPALCFVLFFASIYRFGSLLPSAKWGAIFISYATLNGILYYPQEFLVYDFYRYDGNIYLSFAPLLITGLLSIRGNIDRIIFFFLLLTTLISALVVVIQFAKGTPIPLTGLFSAHNAFGGFLMFSACAAIAYLRYRRTILAAVILLVQFVILYASYSRGSILGVLCAGICYWAFVHKRRWIPGAMIAVIAATQIFLLTFSYPIFLKLGGAQSANTEDYARDNASSGEDANVLIRLVENWPRGVYTFFQSPIFGTGFGSINDVPYKFDEQSWPFSFNQSSEHSFNSAHAHHSYLHILGEFGIVGFIFFIIMWRKIYLNICKESQFKYSQDVIYMSYWTLIFASFTEHRISSPSNAFPFVLSYLLYIAANKYQETQVKKELIN
jgi:O-antigen ligase